MSEEKQAYDVDLEQLVLGSCFRDNVLIDIVRSEISAEAFYDPMHQRLFAAMLERRSEGLITPRTLFAFLHDDPGLETVGGLDYLEAMRSIGNEAAPIRQYGAILRELALKRNAIQDMEDAVWVLKHTAQPVAKAIAPVVVIADRAAQAEVRARPVAADEIGRRVIQQAERAYAGERIPSVTTGLQKFDDAIGGMQGGDLIIIPGRSGMGKAQPLDAPVLMADGAWREIGQLNVGDSLASVDGSPSVVNGVFLRGQLPTYRVTLSDGRSTVVAGDHLWEVQNASAWKTSSVLSTDEIARLLTRKRYRGRLGVPVATGDFGANVNLPLHPYVLGCLIGDGGIKGGAVRFTSADKFVVDRLAAHLPEQTQIIPVHGKYAYSIKACSGYFKGQYGAQKKGNAVKKALVEFGLAGLGSEDKFIPALYMSASRGQRLELLRGLMDTDGWAEKHASVRFCTTSSLLADHVCTLVRSLGGLCSVVKRQTKYRHKSGERVDGRLSYICRIRHESAETLFALERKAKRARRTRNAKVALTIDSVEAIGVQACVCISVSHPRHLYITDDYIVTHNTALLCGMSYRAAAAGHPTLVFSLEMMGQQWVERILSDIDYDDAQVPFGYGQFRRGSLSAEQLDRAARAQTQLNNLPLEICDAGDVTVEDIAARARAFKAKYPSKLGLVEVDYLQRVKPSGHKDRSREQEVSHISRTLKNLAKSLEWPVVAAAQLLTKGGDPKQANKEQIPTLAAIRESGQIEMDADIIMAPHRKAWFLRKERPTDSPDDSPEMVQWRGEYRACKNIIHGYGLKMRHGGEFDLDLWCDMRGSAIRDEEPRISMGPEDRAARDLLDAI